MLLSISIGPIFFLFQETGGSPDCGTKIDRIPSFSYLWKERIRFVLIIQYRDGFPAITIKGDRNTSEHRMDNFKKKDSENFFKHL